MAVPALLIDDGELADVREILGELGVEHRWLATDRAQAEPCEAPSRVLVTTARYALRGGMLAGEASSRPLRMAVLDGEREGISVLLRERGFDYVVRRPVHPITLQLLLLRALYRGDERRGTARVPIGCRTRYRTSVRARPALLVDLSRRGCRFHAARALEPDTEIRIELPKGVAGDEVLELPGWVVRCEREPVDSAELPFSIGLAFDLLPDDVDARLHAALEAHAAASRRVPAEEAEEAWREWMQAAPARRRKPAAAGARSGRRRAARRPFRQQVEAITPRERGLRTLVGRNLSAGGMLVDPAAELRVGDRLALTLFGAPGQRLEVRARVVRSDADHGLALAFDPMLAEAAAALEALIARLEPEDASEAGARVAFAAVVGEITRRGRGPSGC